MILKSSFILLVLGVCLVSSATVFRQPDAEREAVTPKPHSESIFSKLKHKATALYESVKEHWPTITNEIGETVEAVGETFHSAKEKTLKLVDDAEQLYHKIKVAAKKDYENFGNVYKDLTNLVHGLKEHGGEAYTDFKKLLDEVKQDVVDFKKFVKTGNFTILKQDFYKTKVKYDSFKISFDKTLDSVKETIKQTGHDTVVLIDGIERDVTEVVDEAKHLFEETKREFDNIVHEGKKTYEKFKKAYNSLQKVLGALKDRLLPERFEKLDNALKVIKNFVNKHETLATVVEELGTVEEEVAAEQGLMEALELLALL